MSTGYTEQFYCADCGTPLDYARKIDPVIYVRNERGQDRDFCDRCCGPIISDAMDEICNALFVAPAEDTNVYCPHPDQIAAQ